MPYINDRLAAEHDAAEQRDYKRSTARQSRFLFQPEKVMQLLRKRIVGQDGVLAAIDDMLHVVKADIGNKQRPLSVMMFLGPTGVGKTETARLVAEGILGSSDALCRIDMNTLAQEHYSAALTGAPPGYVGSKEGQSLLNNDAIAGSFSLPSVVLFDEIEKASDEVIRALLNVLDTGKLLMASGVKEIDFRNSLIFMSSNVGASDVDAFRSQRHHFWGRGKQERRIVERALHKKFDPEFINRIDAILSFRHLQREHLFSVLDLELAKLQLRLEKRQVALQLDLNCRNYLVEKYDARYGARHIARRLRRDLEPAVARAMLAKPDEREFIAFIQNERIVVEALQ
ncbi:AAA family ATPase [uncultured Zhongshania sp.]|uniref:AAA family ATPase n=1 Tax=uncultured Zhongshania sp. TaxID=1642288 RepID=UPI0030D77A08|tara:strand:- start:842 stop:1867 length:1026 start_codon:yes stop_codon:yes gene_type:complete